jgi:hypothetical protein
MYPGIILGSSPISLKRKAALFLISMSSVKQRNSLWPIDSLPGQRHIRFAKKGSFSSLPKAGFRRYQPGDPFPPAYLCGRKAGWT